MSNIPDLRRRARCPAAPRVLSLPDVVLSLQHLHPGRRVPTSISSPAQPRAGGGNSWVASPVHGLRTPAEPHPDWPASGRRSITDTRPLIRGLPPLTRDHRDLPRGPVRDGAALRHVRERHGQRARREPACEVARPMSAGASGRSTVGGGDAGSESPEASRERADSACKSRAVEGPRSGGRLLRGSGAARTNISRSVLAEYGWIGISRTNDPDVSECLQGCAERGWANRSVQSLVVQ